jgi:hypothetical protein
MRLLVEAELLHHPVDGVLLPVHVKHQRHLRLLVVLVSEAQRREALWCAGHDSLLCVRRPPDVGFYQRVELTDEVFVRPLRLLVNTRGLHTEEM